jgi:dienelactone hydrolase
MGVTIHFTRPEHEIHRYPCGHAFANAARPSFDPQSAEVGGQRTAAFLAEHLC